MSSGRFAPCGGMARAWSLRTTFSHTSGADAARAASSFSSDRPEVFRRSLWQETQYVAMASRTDAASLVTTAGDAPVTWGLAARTTLHADNTTHNETTTFLFTTLLNSPAKL